jgi:hypothetical protein
MFIGHPLILKYTQILDMEKIWTFPAAGEWTNVRDSTTTIVFCYVVARIAYISKCIEQSISYYKPIIMRLDDGK